MTPPPDLAFALTSLVCAAPAWSHRHPARRVLHALRHAIEDRVAAVERRWEVLRPPLDRLRRRLVLIVLGRRIGQLGTLVDRAERQGLFSAAAAARLRTQIDQLRAQARARQQT